MSDCDSPQEELLPSPVAAGLPNITPDLVEQEVGEEMDNIVPTYGYQQLPMVGIGGSAGSIRALQAFFRADAVLVFVVMHRDTGDDPEMDEDAGVPGD